MAFAFAETTSTATMYAIANHLNINLVLAMVVPYSNFSIVRKIVVQLCLYNDRGHVLIVYKMIVRFFI